MMAQGLPQKRATPSSEVEGDWARMMHSIAKSCIDVPPCTMSNLDVDFDAEIVVRREMGRSLVFLMVRAAESSVKSVHCAISSDGVTLSSDQQNSEETELCGAETPGLLQITLDQGRHVQLPIQLC